MKNDYVKGAPDPNAGGYGGYGGMVAMAAIAILMAVMGEVMGMVLAVRLNALLRIISSCFASESGT